MKPTKPTDGTGLAEEDLVGFSIVEVQEKHPEKVEQYKIMPLAGPVHMSCKFNIEKVSQL